jgi:DNA-binding response OmpR family regulator
MRLLIIEDDAEARELLAELFRFRDWDVTVCATVETARRALREEHFDVVISDEDVFGDSGSALIREAASQGLLRDVGVLMYTAELGRLNIPVGVRVLRKPLAVAALLDEANAAIPEPSCIAAPSSGTHARGYEAVDAIEAVPSSRAR